MSLQKIPSEPDKDINDYFKIMVEQKEYHIKKPNIYQYNTVYSCKQLFDCLSYKLKTFNVGSVIVHPINNKLIYNHKTDRWVNKECQTGLKIVKEAKNIYQVVNNQLQIITKEAEIIGTREKILNPDTGRMVFKDGKIGLKIQENEKMKQQTVKQ